MEALAAAALALILMAGDTSEPTDPPSVDAEAGAGSFTVKSVKEANAKADKSDPNDGRTDAGPHIAVEPSAAETCTDFTSDHQTNQAAGVTYCTPEDSEDQPQLTISAIQKAFGELKLDPGVLNIEPPDHVTLVNFDTNFFTTTTEPVTVSLTLLGQAVTLEATPSAYEWTFGDGQSLRTTSPGAPYPALTVTHNYLLKGEYAVTLATTYTGRYRVGDGAWQVIPGAVTREGASQMLRAIEAEPKLVGY